MMVENCEHVEAGGILTHTKRDVKHSQWILSSHVRFNVTDLSRSFAARGEGMQQLAVVMVMVAPTKAGR